MTHRRRTFLLATSLLLALGVARADGNYPDRPVKIIVTVAPGAAGDALIRKIGEPFRKLLGQPVIIENKQGAQGALASRAAAKAPNDGYTLLVGGNSSHAANVHMIKDLGYDPVKDFTPISQLTINPLMLVVRSDMPVHTVQEFIQYAKQRPGKLSYGTGNSGSLVAAQLLKTQAGIDAVGVNYPGMAQAATDLLGGRLDFIMLDPVVAAPFVQSGQLRMLGITSRQRLSAFPNVAPLSESGLPNYEYQGWVAMFAPAGVPPAIAQRLSQAFGKVMAEPEVQKFASDVGMIPYTSTPDRLQAFVQEQIKAWGRWTKEAGVQPL
jgi:tripartite-type tricarboxylate transporter receptor subunit TctC